MFTFENVLVRIERLGHRLWPGIVYPRRGMTRSMP